MPKRAGQRCREERRTRRREVLIAAWPDDTRGQVLLVEPFQSDPGALDQAPEVLAVDLGQARSHRDVAAGRSQHALDEVGLEAQEDTLAQLAKRQVVRLGFGSIARLRPQV